MKEGSQAALRDWFRRSQVVVRWWMVLEQTGQGVRFGYEEFRINRCEQEREANLSVVVVVHCRRGLG